MFLRNNHTMIKFLPVVLLVLLVGCKSTPSVVYQEGEVTSPNAPIIRVLPKYPKSALDENISGYVKAKFVIQENGSVSDIVIIESVPESIFDAEAIRVLKKWKYKPALLNGKTVSSWAETQLDWNHPSTKT